jgi:hypothetical protein
MLRFARRDGPGASTLRPSEEPLRRHTRSLRRTPPQRPDPLLGELRRTRSLSRARVRPVEVELGPHEPIHVVPELPQPAIAVEAQNPADPTCRVFVVHVVRVRPVADRAHPTLIADQLIDVISADAVAMPLGDSDANLRRDAAWSLSRARCDTACNTCVGHRARVEFGGTQRAACTIRSLDNASRLNRTVRM